MAKGTPSMGQHGRGNLHMVCRRCGSKSRHKSTGICSQCGFGKTARKRSYNWSKKTKRT
jgi:large subunit ribosomal protein L37e